MLVSELPPQANPVFTTSILVYMIVLLFLFRQILRYADIVMPQLRIHVLIIVIAANLLGATIMLLLTMWLVSLILPWHLILLIAIGFALLLLLYEATLRAYIWKKAPKKASIR